MLFIGTDIGGTHARWELARDTGKGIAVLYAMDYATREFASAGDMLERFLEQAGIGATELGGICMAIPGPVNENRGQLTNVDWSVDGAAISVRFSRVPVQLVNDLQAAARGTLALKTEELTVINDRPADMRFPRLTIGLGTGLGSAWLIHNNGAAQTLSTEAGHADFAPADQEQRELASAMYKIFPRLAWEHLLGGHGLPYLYRFYGGTPAAAPDAAAVNCLASEGEPYALAAVRLFTRLLAAYAGNMALAFQPRDGIYLVGGAAAKMARWISPISFMEAFVKKDRMSELLGEFPVYLVTDDRVGIKGAVMTAINR